MTFFSISWCEAGSDRTDYRKADGQKSVCDEHVYWFWGMAAVFVSEQYSCRQSKSSNLQTDFLGLRKASELVDNGINKFLLMSFINSNEQNFQK